MINIETLLSSFDDRGTLMRWLNAVEKALNDATLTSVEVLQISTQVIKLKFNFADNTSIITPEITLPKGEKGDKGDKGATGETGATGVSVTNVTVNANNHLLVTLSNGTVIDAGEINVTSGVVIDTTLSTTSENPVQNRVITLALNAKASQANLTALLARVDTVEGDIDTIGAQLPNKANASDVYTKTEANSLLSEKQATLNTSNVPTGTIVDKIGFDANGALKRATDSGGGGTQKYRHRIACTTQYGDLYLTIENTESTPYTDIFNAIGDNYGSAQLITYEESIGVGPQSYVANCLIYPAKGYEHGRMIVIGTDGFGSTTLKAGFITVTSIIDTVTPI